jgi:hypothetical protein
MALPHFPGNNLNTMSLYEYKCANISKELLDEIRSFESNDNEKTLTLRFNIVNYAVMDFVNKDLETNRIDIVQYNRFGDKVKIISFYDLKYISHDFNYEGQKYIDVNRTWKYNDFKVFDFKNENS